MDTTPTISPTDNASAAGNNPASGSSSNADMAGDISPTMIKKNSNIGRKFSLAVCLLLVLSMCVFWLISTYNAVNMMQQQANNLGQTLAQQTASLVTELVLANDMISMNVVLAQLTQDSTISEALILNVDGQVIAASSRPPLAQASWLPRLDANYTAAIALADGNAGYVRIQLDQSYIQASLFRNLLYIIAATVLLLIVAATMTSTYYQYLVSFPLRVLTFSLANIRKGEISTCPEPDRNNDVSHALRQYNATAEFLAQNTFISSFAHRLPDPERQAYKQSQLLQDATIVCISLSNYQYLASTQSEAVTVALLNKYYFFAEKVSQLYGGIVCSCNDGELIINFASSQYEDEQAFYAISAGQLFLQLIDELGENTFASAKIACKFKLAVHSGKVVYGLYSPISGKDQGLMGKTLDVCRLICVESPDNALLVSHNCLSNAGAETRVDAQKYSLIDDGDVQLSSYLCNNPLQLRHSYRTAKSSADFTL
ncbi:MAG: hypothetical protein COC19_01630 [SAR86 cluster bacterium]|uniref:Guanylate cyclase domain-containing protein n=1 Tax=SAR86 cluster bacterium TaxID=2030880 RepID=A0A2A4MT43_9GAMM|nr:MAG: hypothetical protein COC19_01630 [SAR86 cluster bacterium]